MPSAIGGLPIFGLIALGIAVFHVIEMGKHVTNKDKNAVLTTLAGLGLGSVAAFTGAISKFLGPLVVHQGNAVKAVLALAIGGVASLVYKYFGGSGTNLIPFPDTIDPDFTTPVIADYPKTSPAIPSASVVAPATPPAGA
ncbi:MAG: hypothetical protein ACYDCC_04890 [Actinomycetota bacterium]